MSDINTVLLSNPASNQLDVEEGLDYVPVHQHDPLWRDAFGDGIRKQTVNSHIQGLLSYINSDGMPEQFQRLTSDYLAAMIDLISQRLGVAPFRQLNECTDTIPQRFYHINYAAYDSLRHCSDCLSDIGLGYVTKVHDLALELFNCLDNRILPVETATTEETVLAAEHEDISD